MSMDAGSRSRFTFSGTGVRWIGYRDAWSGKARIWLDGTAVATVDTYSASDQAQAVVFDKEGLAAGTHTIEIEALQQKSASSGGMWVWIDAFDVTSGSGTTGTGGTGGTGGGGTGVLIWSDGFENGGVTRWSGDRVQ